MVRLGSGCLFSSILWKKLLRRLLLLLTSPPRLISSVFPEFRLRLSSRAARNLVASSEVKLTVWDLTPRNFSHPGAPLAAMVAGDSLFGVEAGVLLPPSPAGSDRSHGCLAL